MKKAAFHNLGCKVNSYETEAMQQMLEKAGYEIVPFTEKADVYVINTCSVTNIADKKSRQMLHKAKKENPEAIIVAAGCYVQTSKEEAMKDESIDLLIGNDKKHELVQLLEELQEKNHVIDINDGNREFEELHIEKTAEHTRVFVKIQDGCNQFCSYCIIPYARGRVRSRKTKDILQEVQQIAKNGYQEVVLTGIHIGSFGIDTGEKLIELIEAIEEIPGIERIRIGSLEPKTITKEFTERLSKLKHICPHFHLSLQSGCDETLKRMNRKYTTEEYKAAVEMLRTYFENPAITTDVIVGFPGETEEEFNATKKFLKDIHFSEMHVFKYSKRKGTKAAVMENQVPEQVKSERSAVLLALEKEMSFDYKESFLNKTVEILLEEKITIDQKEYYVGHTKEYIKFAVNAEEKCKNQIIKGVSEKRLLEDIYLLVEI